jgi:hypothetical protein
MLRHRNPLQRHQSHRQSLWQLRRWNRSGFSKRYRHAKSRYRHLTPHHQRTAVSPSSEPGTPTCTACLTHSTVLRLLVTHQVYCTNVPRKRSAGLSLLCRYDLTLPLVLQIGNSYTPAIEWLANLMEAAQVINYIGVWIVYIFFYHASRLKGTALQICDTRAGGSSGMRIPSLEP